MKHYGLILALTSCVHVHPTNVTGMYGRACHMPALVQVAPEISDEDSEQVLDAIDYINDAFGGELLRPVGSGKPDVVVVYAHPQLEYNPFEKEGQPVAQTNIETSTTNGCLGLRVITLIMKAECGTWAWRQTTIRHELLHSLGVPHSFWDGGSLMAPAAYFGMPEPIEMTDADLAALKAIYR